MDTQKPLPFPNTPAPTAGTHQAHPLPTLRTVLVVGATGFLGAKICRELAAIAGVRVRALSRRPGPAHPDSAVKWVQGDLMQPSSLDAALAGVDVVVSSANGYMKESIDVDFQGNKNLIEAAARARVQRFVFLSIVACEAAATVPHFHAKKVAEDLIMASGMPYVLVRAPAFLDQSADYVADGVKAGRFVAAGDRTTRWSYVLTDDLAAALAKAATYPDASIEGQSIDVGWRDGPMGQGELARLIGQIAGKRLSVWVIPWWVLSMMVHLVKPFSELGYDLIQMLLFFRTGKFVSDTAQQERFFGPAPTAHDAVTRWLKQAP